MSEPECRIYRIHVLDPRTGYTTKTLGYIGETLRLPIERLMEHIAGQWWADTFAGCEVDDTVYPGKVAVVAAEERAVKNEKPLYNIEFNGSNPQRIPPWEQEAQRRERDAKRGLVTAKPVKVRAPRATPRTVATSPPRPPRPKVAPPKRREPAAPDPPSWLGSAFAAVFGWVVLAAALWWVRADEWQGADGARSASLWSGAVVIGVAVMSRSSKKTKRRR